jgi:acyl-coenzyme A thioesterase PaaI-like protein
MSSPEAIPVQRVFLNKKDNAVVNIVWFGHGVNGWPRVVHGGALATVLDETMGRVALSYFPAQTGKT